MSSVLPAAYRALESEQVDALFQDPLAEGLAGPAAVEDARLQTPVRLCLSRTTTSSTSATICI